MSRREHRGVKASLRLCFVKLPGTQDHRIFRDVIHLHEPEDKCFQDLSDLVEKKLAFMEIPPAEFTVFHTDKTSGDRLVVDDAYLGELIADWFRQLYARRKSMARQQGRKQHKPTMNTCSFSQEGQPPAVLGLRSPGGKGESGAAELLEVLSSSSGTGGSSSSAEIEGGDPLNISTTFEIEVNRLRNLHGGGHAVGGTGTAESALDQRTPPSQTRVAEGPMVLSAPRGGGSDEGVSPCSLLNSQRHHSGPVSAQPPPAVPVGQGTGVSSSPACVPLTVHNLTTLMKQGALSPPPPPPVLQPRAAQAADRAAAPLERPEEVHVHVADLVCPPQPPNFLLRCVAVDLRFKMPRPGLSIAEIDLCDVADPRQAITGVTFDVSVQKEMKETLRCDGRQVLELRHVYVRRKNEADMRYATNPHPLLLRIDRSSKLEVVQVLTVPVFTRAPVVSSVSPYPFGHAASGDGGVAGPVVSVRETGAMRSGGGVVALTDLARQRGGAPGLGTGVGAGSGSELAVALGLSSSSSSSTGARRTTFTFGSGNHTVGGSSTSGALVSGVVPSALGSQLRQRQQQHLFTRAVQQQQHHLQQAAPYEPGVIPVSMRDVRAREAYVEQHASKEERQKARIRRKLEVSQACILCGLDLSHGHEEDCLAAVRRLLEASYRNKGTHIPSWEELHDALCDRRPLLRRQPNESRHASGGAGTAASGKRRPTRLTCQQTFVNVQTRANHVVHCRCAHLCTQYQEGGNLEDIAWCELPMQMCSLCGFPGACVACYHPDCQEMYHVVCALFSGGYVNFGKKDPFLPCPACPRHTQVILSHGRKHKGAKDGAVLHVDESCWEDGDIVFDSRVVADGDLRDPDENEGE